MHLMNSHVRCMREAWTIFYSLGIILGTHTQNARHELSSRGSISVGRIEWGYGKGEGEFCRTLFFHHASHAASTEHCYMKLFCFPLSSVSARWHAGFYLVLSTVLSLLKALLFGGKHWVRGSHASHLSQHPPWLDGTRKSICILCVWCLMPSWNKLHARVPSDPMKKVYADQLKKWWMQEHWVTISLKYRSIGWLWRSQLIFWLKSNIVYYFGVIGFNIGFMQLTLKNKQGNNAFLWLKIHTWPLHISSACLFDLLISKILYYRSC